MRVWCFPRRKLSEMFIMCKVIFIILYFRKLTKETLEIQDLLKIIQRNVMNKNCPHSIP